MGFGDLKSESGVKNLNDYLQDKSYVEGYQPSQADTVVFNALSEAPKEELFNALRWYNHIKSYGSEMSSFPGAKKDLSEYGPITNGKGTAKNDDDDDDDDDMDDLFGSDVDEEEEARLAAERQRIADEAMKAKKKKAPIAKSSIVLAVKGYGTDADWKKIEGFVRGVECDGLKWGKEAKLVPVAFGVKEMHISCVVEDEKCGTDFLEESIMAFEDDVQSVDIVAFNKI